MVEMSNDSGSTIKRLQLKYKDLLGQIGKEYSAETFWGKHEDRNDPGVINPTSFLVIKAFNGDIGDRPIGDDITGSSPSVKFLSSSGEPIRNIEEFRAAGHSDVSVCITVSNMGGIDVPSAKVHMLAVAVWGDVSENPEELIPKFERRVELLKSAWVPAESETDVVFDRAFYELKQEDFTSGTSFKYEVVTVAVLVRAYSLSPRDYPTSTEDWPTATCRHTASRYLPNKDLYSGNHLKGPLASSQ